MKIYKSNKGVSYIELTIIIVLTSILISSVSFTSKGFEKNLLKKECIEIEQILNEARTLALIENRRYSVQFLQLSKSIRVTYVEGRKVITHNVYYLDNIEYLSVVTNSNDKIIEYTKEGTVSTASTITLSSKNYKGELTVNLGSGFVNFKGIEKIGA